VPVWYFSRGNVSVAHDNGLLAHLPIFNVIFLFLLGSGEEVVVRIVHVLRYTHLLILGFRVLLKLVESLEHLFIFMFHLRKVTVDTAVRMQRFITLLLNIVDYVDGIISVFLSIWREVQLPITSAVRRNLIHRLVPFLPRKLHLALFYAVFQCGNRGRSQILFLLFAVLTVVFELQPRGLSKFSKTVNSRFKLHVGHVFLHDELRKGLLKALVSLIVWRLWAFVKWFAALPWKLYGWLIYFRLVISISGRDGNRTSLTAFPNDFVVERFFDFLGDPEHWVTASPHFERLLLRWY